MSNPSLQIDLNLIPAQKRGGILVVLGLTCNRDYAFFTGLGVNFRVVRPGSWYPKLKHKLSTRYLFTGHASLVIKEDYFFPIILARKPVSN